MLFRKWAYFCSVSYPEEGVKTNSGLVIYSEGYILILPALQKFEETQVQGINAETLNLFIDSLQD